MGQETRNASGLGPEEVSRGLGRGPCELRGLRGRRGWRTWVAMQRWSRQGPTGKVGQETRPRWRAGKPWVRRDSSCGGLSPGDHSATRQGWPVGRPQRSRRSERHPAEKATKSPRVPGRTRSVGNRRPGAVMGAQPVPAEWTPRRLAAGAPWVQGPRCRARRAAQSAAVRASDTGGRLGSKESG
jgi:hypothetical protein